MAQLLLWMKNKIQFLESLMDKRLSFALKTCGFESSSVSLFSSFFNLWVCILDFVYTWIYLFESGIRLFNKYTRRNVNNFNMPKCNNSLHARRFKYFCCHPKLTYSKHLSGTLSVSNGLYPDKDRRSVGTDLGRNCLQRLSVDSKSRRWQVKSEET